MVWWKGTSEKRRGCLRAGCWYNLDWWVPVWSTCLCALECMRLRWRATSERPAWMTQFLWSDNDRVSCPHFRKKKNAKTSLVFAGLALDNKLSARSSPRANVRTILTYFFRAYSMCQYRQHGSHYVSYMESLSWKIQIQKKDTRERGEKSTFWPSEWRSVWFGSSLYLD